ncbi:MAG: SusC/RagA family TonB-linked outer membrane protein, partial [Sphingobacteriales bacterium]
MKLTILLLFITLMQVSASSFAQTITLSEKKASLQSVLKKIQRQSGYDLVYTVPSLANARPVTLQVKEASLKDVLDRCFADQPLEYRIEKQIIVVFTKEKEKVVTLQKAGPQADKILGKVTDSTGRPLPGATVKIQGTTTAVSTGTDGGFTIDVQKDDVLEISYLGFISRSLTINNTGEFLTIVLKESISTLNDVVVVGYGTQKKINLTGAVVSINKKQIESRGVANISNILAGQAPGLTVLQRGGPPGRDMGSWNIRGVGTLGNANPLLIVDGIQTTDVSQVNSNDIESVSILKDAASSSIYGINGANGVIIITTKRGVAGKLKVGYEFQGGYSDLGNVPDGVNSFELATLYNEAQTNDGVAASALKFSAGDLAKFKDGSSPSTHANTVWVDRVFNKSGKWFSHNLTLNGGTEDTRYNISLGYLDQDGLMDNTGYKRYNFRTNFDQKISDRITTGFNIAASVRDVKDPATVLGVGGENWYLHQAFQQWPNDPVKYDDGRYAFPTWSGLNTNPVAYISSANGYS